MLQVNNNTTPCTYGPFVMNEGDYIVLALKTDMTTFFMGRIQSSSNGVLLIKVSSMKTHDMTDFQRYLFFPDAPELTTIMCVSVDEIGACSMESS